MGCREALRLDRDERDARLGLAGVALLGGQREVEAIAEVLIGSQTTCRGATTLGGSWIAWGSHQGARQAAPRLTPPGGESFLPRSAECTVCSAVAGDTKTAERHARAAARGDTAGVVAEVEALRCRARRRRGASRRAAGPAELELHGFTTSPRTRAGLTQDSLSRLRATRCCSANSPPYPSRGGCALPSSRRGCARPRLGFAVVVQDVATQVRQFGVRKSPRR